MIGTNQATTFIQIYDGRIFAVLTKNSIEKNYDVIQLTDLYEDCSYDNVDTLLFDYNSVLHHNVTINGLILV